MEQEINIFFGPITRLAAEDERSAMVLEFTTRRNCGVQKSVWQSAACGREAVKLPAFPR